MRLRAAQVVSAEGKQHLIADLYEKFFQTAFKSNLMPRIVYTPVEVVDFHPQSRRSRQPHPPRQHSPTKVYILDGFIMRNFGVSRDTGACKGSGSHRVVRDGQRYVSSAASYSCRGLRY